MRPSCGDDAGGAEDRRSKLSIIYLGQRTLVTFWSSVFSVLLPAMSGVLEPPSPARP